MPYEYMKADHKDLQTAHAFNAMRGYALELLDGLSPQTIADNTALTFDAQTSTFSVHSLGQAITIHYPSYDVFFTGTDQTMHNHWLFGILHYLSTADGTPLSGEMIKLRMLPGGFIRGSGFDRDCSIFIAEKLGNMPLPQLQQACTALGARLVPSRGDICAVFPFLPRLPLTLQVWLADDEMPGSGQLLIDSSAGRYLSTEDVVTVSYMLLEFLDAHLALLATG